MSDIPIKGKVLHHSVHPEHKYSQHFKQNLTVSIVLLLFAHNVHVGSHASCDELSIFIGMLKLLLVAVEYCQASIGYHKKCEKLRGEKRKYEK